MAIRTRIKEAAHERGFTVREIARKAGYYPSNLSLMDAGRRSVSLRALDRIARVLGCSPAELLEVPPPSQAPLFRRRKVNEWVMQRDLGTPDGAEKGWVHTVMLAWQRHYRAARAKR